jgi:hypothetical protein
MDTTIAFTSCSFVASEGDSVAVHLIAEIVQDGADQGGFSLRARIPSEAGRGVLDYVEVALPEPVGPTAHGVPDIPHAVWCDAVAQYLIRLLGNVARHPTDVSAFTLRWTITYVG